MIKGSGRMQLHCSSLLVQCCSSHISAKVCVWLLLCRKSEHREESFVRRRAAEAAGLDGQSHGQARGGAGGKRSSPLCMLWPLEAQSSQVLHMCQGVAALRQIQAHIFLIETPAATLCTWRPAADAARLMSSCAPRHQRQVYMRFFAGPAAAVTCTCLASRPEQLQPARCSSCCCEWTRRLCM